MNTVDILNATVAILAVVLAFTSIGGETWRKDYAGAFWRGLTGRGWLAVACLVATATCEIASRRIESRQHQEEARAAVEQEAKARQDFDALVTIATDSQNELARQAGLIELAQDHHVLVDSILDGVAKLLHPAVEKAPAALATTPRGAKASPHPVTTPAPARELVGT